MIAEIILALSITVGIFALTGTAAFIAFILPNLLKGYGYPVDVPGWKAKLNQLPPFNAALEDISNGLALFLDRAVLVKNYDRDKLRDKLNGLQILFIVADNEDGGRYIIDKFGRKIAGDHTDNLIRLVVLEEDTLDKTAFFHELGHEAHELEDKVDYEHEDLKMWSNVVGWCRENFKKG